MPSGKRHPVIIGHRGAAGLAPENTFPAFRKAIELGIDGVELDVQRTVDNALVVFHDDSLDRTTDGSGLLREKPFSELTLLDAGSWFDSPFAGERIPTLNQVLELFKDTDLTVHIELKSPHLFPGIETEVARLIKENQMSEQVQVRSFDHEILRRFHVIAPEVAISELWFDRLPDDNETQFPTINALADLYTPEAIQNIHARGQKATAWTVNSPEAAKELIEMGIDGLTSDFPDRLLTIVE